MRIWNRPKSQQDPSIPYTLFTLQKGVIPVKPKWGAGGRSKLPKQPGYLGYHVSCCAVPHECYKSVCFGTSKAPNPKNLN